MLEVLDVGFRPDDRIGNYRVVCELGPTGSGLLIQARHLVLPRRAMIKVVRADFAEVHPYVIQTLREACILEAMAHPGVPTVYESGLLRDRRPWFAFELIVGPTLEELLAEGPLSVIEVAALLCDVADILAYVHARGVIHRGLRPERIVVTGDRRYPLCIPDWSEAVAHDATAGRAARGANAAASDDYVAPELAPQAPGVSQLIDDRVDMFSLGVIGYRALTGVLPFAGVAERGPCVPVHERRRDAPRELATIIDALLAFDRFDRPSASDVRGELEWLFGALPELQQSAARSPPPARGATELSCDDLAGPGDGDARGLHAPRLRRPRWTPEVHRHDAGDTVDAVVPEDHFILK